MLGFVPKAEPAQAGQRLRGERLVELHDIEARRRQLQSLAELARRRDRADPHHPRRDARSGEAEDSPRWGSGHALRPPRSEARISAAAPSLTPDALPAVTLPSGRTMPFNFASASMRRVRTRVLVLGDAR